VRKPRTRWEDAILREILEYEDGRDEQKTERNGGVLWGWPGPRRGCTSRDGWMNGLLTLMNCVRK
jgi:hypothetical protein